MAQVKKIVLVAASNSEPIDCSYAKASIHFTWEALDEMEKASGDGYAELQDNGSNTGEISFHMVMILVRCHAVDFFNGRLNAHRLNPHAHPQNRRIPLSFIALDSAPHTLRISWTNEPGRFTLDLCHQTPEPNR